MRSNSKPELMNTAAAAACHEHGVCKDWPSDDSHEDAALLRRVRQSPENLGKFLDEATCRAALRNIDRDARSQLDALVLRGKLDLARGAPAPRASNGSTQWWRFAAATCLTALLSLAALAIHWVQLGREIQTQAGEWRTFSLADGTVVNVGPRSRLTLHFSDRLRSVRLAEGEAYFEVAHEPGRPFSVATGIATLRAIGTAFGVSRWQDQLVVTVKEGEVSLSRSRPPLVAARPASEPSPDVTLAAGEQVVVSKSGGAIVPQPVDADEALSWTRGVVVFKETSLSEAVAEFNRRNATQLAVDPRLPGKSVTGTFKADDPLQFAHALQVIEPTAVLTKERGVLRIKMPPHTEGSGSNGG